MVRRKMNAFITREQPNLDSGSYSENESESENDVSYEPKGKKMCCNDKIDNNLPVENEHTYACFPFTNTDINYNNKSDDGNKTSSDYSSESDTNLKDSSGGISERSTSPVSVRCGKGKSITMTLNSGKFTSKRQPKCFTKNAVMARKNREKKKEYVINLEKNVTSLKDSNKKMKNKLSEQQEIINLLKNEVQYFKSILSNSKEISVLLKRICGNDNKFRITSSLFNTTPLQNDNFSTDQINKGTHDCLSSDNIGVPSGSHDFNFDNLYHPLLNDDCNISFLDGNDLDCVVSSPFDCSEMDKMFERNNLHSELNNLESNPFGVCLHVANNQVSLEFCAFCSQNASSVLNSDSFTKVK